MLSNPAFFQGIALVIIVALAAVVSFVIGVVLFRAACDLCGAAPPGFLKSSLLVLLVGVVCAPITTVIGFGMSILGQMFHISPVPLGIMANLACIPPCAIVIGIIYTLSLRVNYLKGTAIGIVQSLLGLLVMSVIGLFLLGSVTLVQGIIRLT